MENKLDISKQNFISVDKSAAVSSWGEYFGIGELVSHEDNDADTATILGFELDIESNEVKVITDKGWTHLDFLVKL